MKRGLDFSKIDVVDMLTAMRIRNVTDEGAEVRYSCPFAGHMFGDERPSAYMNAETTAFYCHGCKERGNAVTFITKHFGISPLEALRQLRDRYDGFREPEGGSVAAELERIFDAEPMVCQTQQLLDDSVLEMFPMTESGRAYLHDRGFSDATIELFELGFDASSGRVTIPVRDVEGHLLGFKARAISPQVQPKYMVLGDTHRVQRYGFAPYEASQVVFGLERITDPEHVVICEGELNVVMMHQLGYTNTAGISGSEMSPAQSRLIRSHSDSVTLFFDSDLAGMSGAYKAVRQLYPYIPVKVVPEHADDPASLSAAEIGRLLELAEQPYEVMFGKALTRAGTNSQEQV